MVYFSRHGLEAAARPELREADEAHHGLPIEGSLACTCKVGSDADEA